MDLQTAMWSYSVVLVLTCLSGIACQEILTTTRCLGAGYTEMTIGCPQGSLIHVIKALAAKTRGTPRSDFCEVPRFELMDCVLYEQQLTEEFRTSCNKFGNCRRLAPYANLEECGDAFQLGIVYQHIEYQCLPGARAAQAVSSEITVTSGSLIEVYTPSYPSAWYTMMAVSCNITLPPNVELHLQLLEFTHNTENICPFMLWVDASKPYCAKKAGQYDALTLGPYSWGGNEQLKLRTAIDKPVPVKFWLKVTAKEPEWQKNDQSWVNATQITCQQHMDTRILSLPVPPAVNAETTTTKQDIIKQEVDSLNGTEENPANMEAMKGTDLKAIIAGSVVGVLVIIALVVLIVVLLLFRKRRGQRKENSDMAYNCHVNLNVALAQNILHKGTPDSTPGGSPRLMKPPHLQLSHNHSIADNTYSDIRSPATPKTPLSPEYAEIGTPLFKAIHMYDDTLPKMSPLYDDTALSQARRQFQESPEDMSPLYATTGSNGFSAVYAEPNKDTRQGNSNHPDPPLYAQPNKGFQLLHDVTTPRATPTPPRKPKVPLPTPAKGNIHDLYAQPHKAPKQDDKRFSVSDTVIIDNDLYSS